MMTPYLHIDIDVGQKAYAHAYGTLGRAAPDRVVVLGTGHQLQEGLFSLTDKDFETPLGITRGDSNAVKRLERAGEGIVAENDFVQMQGLPKAIFGSMVIRLSNSCLSVLAILSIIEPPSQKRQYSINAKGDTHVFNLDLFYLTSRQRNEYTVPGIPEFLSVSFSVFQCIHFGSDSLFLDQPISIGFLRVQWVTPANRMSGAIANRIFPSMPLKAQCQHL